MKPECKAHTRAILLSLLGGAYVGAMVAILTTPTSGQEARTRLKTLGNRILGRTSEEASTVKIQFI